MELDYMDGDRERQWLVIANSDLRSRLRAIEQLVNRAPEDLVQQIKDILNSQ